MKQIKSFFRGVYSSLTVNKSNIVVNPYFPIFCGLVWFVILYPGNPTPDGIRSLDLAKSGVIDAWFTIPYGVIFYFLTFQGSSIAFLTIVQGFFLYGCFSHLLSNLVDTKTKNFILSSLSITPVFWVFGFTLYRDVLFCAGLFLLISLTIQKKEINIGLKPHIAHHATLLLSALLLSTRQNSILWVISCIIVFSLFSRIFKTFEFNLKCLILALIQILIVSILALSLRALVNISEENGFSITKEILVADLNCLVYKKEIESLRWRQVLEELKVGPIENTNSGCSTIDRLYEANNAENLRQIGTRKVLNIWVSEFFVNPINLIGIHMQRIWILFPQYYVPPLSPPKFEIELLPNPPKEYLSSTVFLSVYDLPNDNLVDRSESLLYRVVQKYAALWNKLSFILASPIMLLFVILALKRPLFWQLKSNQSRHNKFFLIVVFLYAISLLSTLAASPSPDVRFVFALLILQYSFIFFLLSQRLNVSRFK